MSESKARTITITYQCCKGKYAADIRLFPSAADVVPALDKLHATDHPECPPLDQPLVADGTGAAE